MESTHATKLHIHDVRHLKDIEIPLSTDKRKHLILTGKNGSGKTSVLSAIASHLEYVISPSFQNKADIENTIAHYAKKIDACDDSEKGRQQRLSHQARLNQGENTLKNWTIGAGFEYTSIAALQEKYRNGQFILAFFRDKRTINVIEPKNIEKIELKSVYTIKDSPSRDLEKYLVDLKTTQAFAQTKGDHDRVKQLDDWFQRFELILQDIYDDKSLRLEFNIDTFRFSIHIDGRQPFDFNSMSMGYAAVFDVISDLIMRMEANRDRSAAPRNYDLEGIVLIDEIETHLHVSLQKEILPILTNLFPHLQFILTTHSPFILSSAKDAVIYDLENRTLVENGLENLPYSGIIEGYFNVDTLSDNLREKFERYRILTSADHELSDKEFAEIAELEFYLDEVPDYLAPNFAAEYQKLNTEFYKRVNNT